MFQTGALQDEGRGQREGLRQGEAVEQREPAGGWCVSVCSVTLRVETRGKGGGLAGVVLEREA